MNKKHSMVIAIIIIVIVAFGLYLVAAKTKVQPPAPIDSSDNTNPNTPEQPVVTTKTYSDIANVFSFSYPAEFTVVPGGTMATQEWRTNTTTNGKLLATLIIPKSFQAGTNFSEATFTVGSSTAAADVKNCLTPQNGERAKGIATIHGVVFNKITLTEAGAGNYYDTTSYRIVKNDQCYAVEYTIHSTNFANYPPELGIKEFDTAKVVSVLEGIVKSFSFTSGGSATSFEGKWTGVEGTSVLIKNTGATYSLNFVMLDGPVNVTGTAQGDGILFTRGGKTYTLRHGNGVDTGMKYLVDKKTCVVVEKGEGYCID